MQCNLPTSPGIMFADYMEMIIEEVLVFLKQISPFQFLDDNTLRNLATKASKGFYPKGLVILQQEGPPSEYLMIIKKGVVKVFINPDAGGEVVLYYRGEGDFFGFLSMLRGDKASANVVATDDTIVYLLRKEDILKLLDKKPYVTEYFLKSFFNKYIDITYADMGTQRLLYGSGARMLFATPVGELLTREIAIASQEITIKEAADTMSKNGISSLVLADEDEVPTGIVTDRDLRDKVVARGREVNDKIKHIMSVSLIKTDARDSCFDALLKMIHYDIHHLLVVDNGQLKGVVTDHDLMMLQGTSPLSITKDIKKNMKKESFNPITGMKDIFIDGC